MWSFSLADFPSPPPVPPPPSARSEPPCLGTAETASESRCWCWLPARPPEPGSRPGECGRSHWPTSRPLPPSLHHSQPVASLHVSAQPRQLPKVVAGAGYPPVLPNRVHGQVNVVVLIGRLPVPSPRPSTTVSP